MVTGCSCDGTVSSQGVLHVWPWGVRTSAPSGSDSNFNVWSFSDEEFDDSAEEQPVSETPTTAATTTESAMRDMTSLLTNLLLCATDENTRAKCGNAPIASPEAPIKFATRKMASVGGQGGCPADFRPVLLFRHVKVWQPFEPPPERFTSLGHWLHDAGRIKPLGHKKRPQPKPGPVRSGEPRW